MRTLVIPKVLLPPGREDLPGKISEFVESVFPHVAPEFQPNRIKMEKDWAVIGGTLLCPECSGKPIDACIPI